MKKYIKPEMDIEIFEIEDVITTSSDVDMVGRTLKTSVNGNEGADYGSQEMSVFD